MIPRIYQRLKELLAPFSVIAEELRIIRELYELELSERKDHLGNPAPIIRLTEMPSKTDTEISYMGDTPKKPSVLEEWLNEVEE